MKKRVLSVLMALTLVLGLFPAVTPHAHAEGCEHVGFSEDGICDTCGYHSGDCQKAWDEYTLDPYDHWVACIYCKQGSWEHHTDGDDEDTLCDVCGIDTVCAHENPEGIHDTKGHQTVCRSCETIIDRGAHSFENGYYHTNDDYHYAECDRCNYYQPEGEAHAFTGGEGEDTGCSICGYTVHNYAWDGKTWDRVDHWVVCGVCEDADWEAHSDGNDADKLCDACGFNLGCPHEDLDWTYDDEGHYDLCTDCSQMILNKETHNFDELDYYQSSDQHYPKCYYCDYHVKDEGEEHVDEDLDNECDVCGYFVHEHTYEYEYWAYDNGKHYPVCDQCDYYVETAGEDCFDNSGDHDCDVCGIDMEWLCDDADDDHKCDVCDTEMAELCTDNDDDHNCDAEDCKRYMKERCADAEDGDWICDTCGRNFCNHNFEYVPTSNGDGTHTATCYYCGEVTEDCYAWHYYESSLDTETTHAASCRCGYELPTEDHTFAWNARNVTGHLLACSICFYEAEWEAHTTQNGTCAVCEMQVTAYDDVYVGGVGLNNGQYLDNSGSVTTTKPAGGYAYYKDGVLELNGYVYEGPGFRWIEYKYDGRDRASIYATTDLTLELKGENSLKTVLPDGEKYTFGDGIAAQNDLTIRGDGSLAIEVNDDGVQAEPGDVTIESGNLTIHADDHGFDVTGSVTMTGGTVTATVGDEGFNVSGDITISDGKIDIIADDIAMDASGTITISGGFVDLTSKEDNGIESSEDIIITGGCITIDSLYWGINASENVVISGGELVCSAAEDAAIWAYDGSVTISGGNLQLESGYGELICAETGICIEGGAQLPEGTEIATSEYGYSCIYGDTLTIETLFSAELTAGSIQLTGSPWGLTVIIAVYNEHGKMTAIQVVDNPGETVTPAVTGEKVTAFFLNSSGVPVRASMPIS